MSPSPMMMNIFIHPTFAGYVEECEVGQPRRLAAGPRGPGPCGGPGAVPGAGATRLAGR